MTEPTFRDVELLSAYLDGKLSGADSTRLEGRLAADPALASIMQDLSQARSLLRRLPQRRAPRNFTLSPQRAGVRPPLPRAYPVLRLASALAGVLFFLTFLGSFVAVPAAQTTKFAAQDTTRVGLGAAPVAATEAPTEPPALSASLPAPTPTLEMGIEAAPAEAPLATGAAQAESPSASPFAGWQAALLGLALVLGGGAFLLRWRADRAFERKADRRK
jgi:hypothetical protein